VTHTDTLDGRTARSARTREAVVRAVLDLVRAGSSRPTAREIAEHAGISLRSVYVHFDDLEDLFLAAAREYVRQLSALLKPIDAILPLRARIAAWADQRASIWESTLPVRRAAELWAPASPSLAEVTRSARQRSWADTRRLFGPEVAGRPDADVLLEMVNVLGSAAAWDTFRERGMTVAAARDILSVSLTKLLET